MNNQLTVAQLIEKLQTFPQDWKVYIDQFEEVSSLMVSVGSHPVEDAWCSGQGEVTIGPIEEV